LQSKPGWKSEICTKFARLMMSLAAQKTASGGMSNPKINEWMISRWPRRSRRQAHRARPAAFDFYAEDKASCVTDAAVGLKESFRLIWRNETGHL